MSLIVLASSEAETAVLLVIIGIVVVSVTARILVSTNEQKKADNKPRSRVLGFAPRDQPEPEPDVPDRIKPKAEESNSRQREGPIEPPPDVELPAPSAKLLPPSDSD